MTEAIISQLENLIRPGPQKPLLVQGDEEVKESLKGMFQFALRGTKISGFVYELAANYLGEDFMNEILQSMQQNKIHVSFTFRDTPEHRARGEFIEKKYGNNVLYVPTSIVMPVNNSYHLEIERLSVIVNALLLPPNYMVAYKNTGNIQ